MPPMHAFVSRSTFAARRSLIAGCLAIAVVAFAGCQKSSVDDNAGTAASSAPRPPAELTIVNTSGVIRYTGSVGDAATRTRVSDSFDNAYAPGRASGSVESATSTQPADWVDGLAALLPELDVPGATLVISGRELRLQGQVAPRDRARLLRAVREVYPGYATTGLFAGVDPDRATSDLPAATMTTPLQKAKVMTTLNTISIAFDDEAGSVSAASLAGVADAARALVSTPDLKVRIALAASGNEALARQRAEALKVQLIINGVSPGAIETSVAPGNGGAGGNTVAFTASDAAVK